MNPLPSPQEFSVLDFPLNGKVLVEAAAGSGKTSNLVWLYLRLLLERAVKPTELVVLTYTRKAAAEIRTRLSRALAELRVCLELTAQQPAAAAAAAALDPMLVQLTERVTQNVQTALKLQPAAVYELLLRRATAAETELAAGSIGTFHGFLHQLFTVHAYALGVPANFNLSHQQNQFLSETLSDFLNNEFYNVQKNPYCAFFLVSGRGVNVFKEELEPFCKRSEAQPLNPPEPMPAAETITTASSAVMQAGTRLLTAYDNCLAAHPRLLSLSAALMEELTALKLSTPKWRAQRLNAEPAPEVLSERYTFPPTTLLSYRAAVFMQGIKQALQWVREHNHPNQLPLAVGLAAKHSTSLWTQLTAYFHGVKKPFANLFEPALCLHYTETPQLLQEDFTQHIKRLSSGANALLTPALSPEVKTQLLNLLSLYMEYLAAAHLLAGYYERVYAHFLGRAVKTLHTNLARRRLGAGIMSYDDLITWAERPAQGGTSLANLLRGRYQAVMIDEFQDTNSRLFALVQQWFKDVPLMFFIGDPRQSVFSFQGADLSAYLSMRTNIARLPGGALYTLNTNYRAHPQLLRVINALYRAPNAFLAGTELSYNPLKARAQPSVNQGSALPAAIKRLSLHLLQASDNTRANERPRIAKWLVQLVQTFTAAERSETAVIVRNNPQALFLERELTQAGIRVQLMRSESEPTDAGFCTEVLLHCHIFLSAVLAAAETQTAAPRRQTDTNSQRHSKMLLALTVPFFNNTYPQTTTLSAHPAAVTAFFIKYWDAWQQLGLLTMLEQFLLRPVTPLTAYIAPQPVQPNPPCTPLNNIFTRLAAKHLALQYIRELYGLLALIGECAGRLQSLPAVETLTFLGRLAGTQTPAAARRSVKLNLSAPESLSGTVGLNGAAIAEELLTNLALPARLRQLYQSQQPQPSPLAVHVPVSGMNGALRIYTMHSSKGLEFATVILPFLMDKELLLKAKNLKRTPFKPDAQTTIAAAAAEAADVTEAAAVQPLPAGADTAWTVELQPAALRREVVVAADQENRRLLYVALTRARERIISIVRIAAAAENNHLTFAGAEALGDLSYRSQAEQLLKVGEQQTEYLQRCAFTELLREGLAAAAAELQELVEVIPIKIEADDTAATMQLTQTAAELTAVHPLAATDTASLQLLSLTEAVPARRGDDASGGYLSSFSALLRRGLLRTTKRTEFADAVFAELIASERADEGPQQAELAAADDDARLHSAASDELDESYPLNELDAAAAAETNETTLDIEIPAFTPEATATSDTTADTEADARQPLTVQALQTLWAPLSSGGDAGIIFGTFFHALMENLPLPGGAGGFALHTEAGQQALMGQLAELFTQGTETGQTYAHLLPYQKNIARLVRQLVTVPLKLPNGTTETTPFCLAALPWQDCSVEVEFMLPTALSETRLARELSVCGAELFAAAAAPVETAQSSQLAQSSQSAQSSQLATLPAFSQTAESAAIFKELQHGFVRGFSDLCFVWQGRYYVLDWKTNALHQPTAAVPQAEHPFAAYHPWSLRALMREYAYDVQACIYILALQRYLQQRLGRAYNAEQHLGGVFYVFVRGVDSTGTYGVIGARPTAQLLTRLDSLFVPQQTSTTTAALQLVPAPEGILQPMNGTSAGFSARAWPWD